MASLSFAVRGSNGFSIKHDARNPQSVFEPDADPKSNPCRLFQFSHSGDYFCYCDSVRTVIVESNSGKEVVSMNLPRTKDVVFSPRDRVLATYEPYAVYGPKTTEGGETRQPLPNLRLWSLPDGANIKTLIAAKQLSWKIQWSDDEVYSLRLVGSELFVYKYNNFEKYDSKLVILKCEDYAMSPGSEPHHLAAYIPASGGQPAVVQLRRLDHKFTVVANKTFFKCDRAHLLWNCKGSAMVVMASLEVDQSNQSYYGEQNLYLVSITGDSCMVPMGKSGPVYCVKWNPNGKEFAVCYGYMPSRVTLYNLKGDATFDFGEGPRNDVFYNTFGNILLLCGFGNIASGKMEFWNVDKREEIIKIEVPNTTYLEWAPDGQYLLTATTTPRLRMDNSYRIWHYSGRLIHEQLYDPPSELWQVQWKPVQNGIYNRFAVSLLSSEDKAKAGLHIRNKNLASEHPANNLPAGSITKSGAYVPPHLRKNGGSKGALKTGVPPVSKLTDLEKKIRNIQKKIDDIAKLKRKKEAGETLEANQLSKIDKEAELLQELEALKV